eukprot:CAMPEP_0176357370 /NCGR_PEP_ID=MMETSP0126-20121128/14728_1 /TAXON_ID=141414 ORGANISM="Strombidinopsis acuminatum, Strain SPMC142" /NCGR_SAMPLE_ID=MMETSP0126 /ASSEMBLY_ACC=CAM_ASM_000229 /LENGTH=40 /DNA_ID= /DNA_START= /DNA_END= /DNA_ORIENTATION=
MTMEFDKVLTDARGVNKAMAVIEEAENNQNEIEQLIEQTL